MLLKLQASLAGGDSPHAGALAGGRGGGQGCAPVGLEGTVVLLEFAN